MKYTNFKSIIFTFNLFFLKHNKTYTKLIKHNKINKSYIYYTHMIKKQEIYILLHLIDGNYQKYAESIIFCSSKNHNTTEKKHINNI